jgi:hypothetical protein
LTFPCPTGSPGTPIAENALHGCVLVHACVPLVICADSPSTPISARALLIVWLAAVSLALLVDAFGLAMITRSDAVSCWTAASSLLAPASSLV